MKSNLPTIVIIIIFSLAHSSCLLSQEQITFRDYKCTITNKQIRIDEYIGNSIVVSIPDSIDGCVVTEIGENAFGSKNILQISIPSTISHIKYGAFQMNQIENIEVPESVKFIGNNILRGNRIKTAKFPEYYQGSIADQFLDNSGIRFNDFEYIIFNEKAVISKYFGSETDIILPSNIEGYPVLAIGAYAFRKKKLNSVVFPKSTIDIGSYAFEGNNLVELNLPKLKRIGDSSFANNKIKKLVLPESILDIGDAAFMNNEISELNLLTKINLIRQQTFENNKLTKLKLPESLNMIEG
ncbi:MAG TPA: leucine-rich repeat domain-containing protein, partial [Edaphocola sp.]|nr:leucine-rich repeat domain-containing protein [Edaphocola sp.]